MTFVALSFPHRSQIWNFRFSFHYKLSWWFFSHQITPTQSSCFRGEKKPVSVYVNWMSTFNVKQIHFFWLFWNDKNSLTGRFSVHNLQFVCGKVEIVQCTFYNICTQIFRMTKISISFETSTNTDSSDCRQTVQLISNKFPVSQPKIWCVPFFVSLQMKCRCFFVIEISHWLAVILRIWSFRSNYSKMSSI